MPFPPTFDRAFDETFPPDTQAANLLGQDIRNLKTDIRERFALLSGLFVNRPTNMDAAFGGVGYGMLYFSTDTNQVFQWNGVTWADVTSIQGVVASVNLTGQVASIGSTTLYTVPAGKPGLYRISLDMTMRVLGAGGNVVANLLYHIGASSPNINTAALSTNAAITDLAAFMGSGSHSIYVINPDVATDIKYSTTLTGGAGCQYELRIRVEYLG